MTKEQNDLFYNNSKIKFNLIKKSNNFLKKDFLTDSCKFIS